MGLELGFLLYLLPGLLVIHVGVEVLHVVRRQLARVVERLDRPFSRALAQLGLLVRAPPPLGLEVLAEADDRAARLPIVPLLVRVRVRVRDRGQAATGLGFGLGWGLGSG